MPLSEVKVEKIDNRAAHHPVEGVAGGATDNKADGERQQRRC